MYETPGTWFNTADYYNYNIEKFWLASIAVWILLYGLLRQTARFSFGKMLFQTIAQKETVGYLV